MLLTLTSKIEEVEPMIWLGVVFAVIFALILIAYVATLVKPDLREKFAKLTWGEDHWAQELANRNGRRKR